MILIPTLIRKEFSHIYTNGNLNLSFPYELKKNTVFKHKHFNIS